MIEGVIVVWVDGDCFSVCVIDFDVVVCFFFDSGVYDFEIVVFIFEIVFMVFMEN